MAARITRERRRHVTRLVRRVGLHHHPEMTDDARLVYVVGALIATGDGRFTHDALRTALADPQIVAVATGILAATKHAETL